MIKPRSSRWTLVVIDVQPHFVFNLAGRTILEPIRIEVARAVKAEVPILLVEYVDCGETLRECFPNGDTSYRRLHRVIKNDNCGAPEVLSTLKQGRLPSTRLRVVGVNTDVCVFETVKELTKIPRIEVIEQGCWSNVDHLAGLRDLRRLHNVVTIT